MPSARGKRPARKRGAGAAWHDLDARFPAITQHGCDLRRRRRQDYEQRQFAIGGQPVGLIGAAFVFGKDDRIGGDDPAQPRGNLLATGDDRRIGRRHVHARPPRCLAAAAPKGCGPATGSSALTGLEARVGLVDDVDPALAPHDPAVLVAFLQRLQGISNLHRSDPGANEAPKIGSGPRPVNSRPRAGGRSAPRNNNI